MIGLNKKFHLCILGSGFGGITVLLNLKSLLKNNPDIEITMISKRPYFLFTPLLHEVATGEVSPENIIYPLKKLEQEFQNFSFIEESVTDINFETRIITGERLKLSYDYLLIALGSDTNYYGNQNIENYSLSLKSLEGAIKIRKQITDALRLAGTETDKRRRKSLLSFVIAGGGATGVELGGAMNDYIRDCIRNSKNISENDIRIYLIEMGDKLLNELDSAKSSSIALKRFNELGLELLLKHEVLDYQNKTVTVFDKSSLFKFEIDSDTFIWTAGIKPATLIENLKLNKDANGKIIVDKYLNVPEYPEVFAVGDNCSVENQDYWTTAQTAVQQAENVAYNIYAKTRLFRYSKPFKYIHQGSLITIGKNFGISDIFGLKVSGFSGWFIWKMIHLLKVNGSSNKFNVFFDWLSSMAHRRYGDNHINT